MHHAGTRRRGRSVARALGLGVVGAVLGCAAISGLAGCPAKEPTAAPSPDAERPELVGRWEIDRGASEAMFKEAFASPEFEPTEGMNEFFEGDRAAMAEFMLAFMRVEFEFAEGGVYRVIPTADEVADLARRGTWQREGEAVLIDDGPDPVRAEFRGPMLHLTMSSSAPGTPRALTLALRKKPADAEPVRTTIQGAWVFDADRTREVLEAGYRSAAVAGTLHESLAERFGSDAAAFAAREIERFDGISFRFVNAEDGGMWTLRVPARGEYGPETETGRWTERDGAFLLDERSAKENRAELRDGELWMMPVVQARRYYPGYAFVFKAAD
ncbi:MAG: hypothetical protein ACF8SC_12165 [Phycisphaerales bacterium JB037]